MAYEIIKRFTDNDNKYLLQPQFKIVGVSVCTEYVLMLHPNQYIQHVMAAKCTNFVIFIFISSYCYNQR